MSPEPLMRDTHVESLGRRTEAAPKTVHCPVEAMHLPEKKEPGIT